MIFVAGISIGLFISALLLSKKRKSRSDIFLILWMILNAIHLSFFYLLYTHTIYDYPAILGLQFPLPLLHGVLLYYYVSSVTNQFPKKTTLALLHLLPALITFVYLIPFTLLPAEQKIEIFKNEGKEYATFQKIILIAVFLSGIIYVVWSSFILRNHKKRIKNQFSDIEEINLKWLQFLVYGLGTVWTFIVTQNDTLIFITVSVFVILIGFFGVQQKNIFGDPSSLKAKKIKEKYSKSGLSKEKEEDYHSQLSKLITEDKIYTNPELSLKELADELEIHPNYLSQIINNREGKTFYDYINTYRVEEFKRLISIPENQQFTLMSIAYDCGFNSKSTFNRYFKKITKVTPSQYVNSIKP